MKLQSTVRPVLITLFVASTVFAFLYHRAYVRRVATHQLFENGFTLAYDRSSVDRRWKNVGFGGGHRAVDKPQNSILDSPSNQTWLAALGMLELANQIEVVDGKRTWLDQKASDGFDDDDLKPIAQLNSVREVSLHWNSIDDDGLNYLSGLSRLERLELDGCPVTDKGLKHLANLTRIEHLSLAFTRITDDGILELGKLQNLKYLCLEGTDVSSGVLSSLQKFRNLETLNLSDTKIGQANIEKIGKLGELESLNIADTGVDNLDRVLRDLPKLRRLVVDGTKLGDNLIAGLQGMQLDELSVNRTSVSQKSIDLILNLKLREAFYGDETGLTPEQLQMIDEDIASRSDGLDQ